MQIELIKNKLDTVRSQVSLHESGKGYQVSNPEIDQEFQLMTRVTTILNRGIPKRELENWKVRQEDSYFSVEFRRRLRTNMSYEETVNMALAVKEESKQASIKIRDTAADWGSRIHHLIDRLSYDSSVFVPSEFSHAVDSWYTWISGNNLSIIATEQPLYFYDEETHVRYCGTADLIAMTQDERILIADYKSGARIYPTYSLQNSAYSMALKQILSALDISTQPKCMVVKLPKTAEEKFEVRESQNVEWQEEVFFAMAENQLLVKSWESDRKKWVPLKKEKVTSDV
jgi:uncharacterized protein YacL (UPF0231 family)